MRALVFHFSSLVGLLIFLNQLWNAEEIERTIFMAFAAGLVMYTVLMIGFAVGHRILVAIPPADEAAGTTTDPDAEQPNTNALNPQNRAEQPPS